MTKLRRKRKQMRREKICSRLMNLCISAFFAIGVIATIAAYAGSDPTSGNGSLLILAALALTGAIYVLLLQLNQDVHKEKKHRISCEDDSLKYDISVR